MSTLSNSGSQWQENLQEIGTDAEKCNTIYQRTEN